MAKKIIGIIGFAVVMGLIAWLVLQCVGVLDCDRMGRSAPPQPERIISPVPAEGIGAN